MFTRENKTPETETQKFQSLEVLENEKLEITFGEEKLIDESIEPKKGKRGRPQKRRIR